MVCVGVTTAWGTVLRVENHCSRGREQTEWMCIIKDLLDWFDGFGNNEAKKEDDFDTTFEDNEEDFFA